MSQVPLIWLMRIPAVKRHPLLGNIMFWIGMSFGQPIIMIMYCYDWAINHGDVKLSF
jgi:hypothetical protein